MTTALLVVFSSPCYSTSSCSRSIVTVVVFFDLLFHVTLPIPLPIRLPLPLLENRIKSPAHLSSPCVSSASRCSSSGSQGAWRWRDTRVRREQAARASHVHSAVALQAALERLESHLVLVVRRRLSHRGGAVRVRARIGSPLCIGRSPRTTHRMPGRASAPRRETLGT